MGLNHDYDRSIISSIQKMAGTYGLDQVYLVHGTVTAVDMAAGTCDIDAVSGTATTPMAGIALQAAIGNGLLIIPKIGSDVKVVWSRFTSATIISYSDIEKMYINGLPIKLNDGTFGGLVKVQELTNKINNLVQTIQTELVKIQTGIIAAGGSYTPGTLNTFNKSDYENTKITHGS